MERYQSLFQEAKQVGVLYHFTSLQNAAQIMKEGGLLKAGGLEFVSFTRNFRMSEIINELSATKDLRVRFAINGDKLSNHYKIEPYIDYVWKITRKEEENEEIIKHEVVKIINTIFQIDIKDYDHPIFKNRNIAAKEYLLTQNWSFPVNIVDSWKPVKLP